MTSKRRRPIVTPDLDLGEIPVTVSVWLVPLGAAVVQGDRVVELLAGDVTVDISAPASGVLVERCAAEDQPVVPGQALGFVVRKE